MIYAKKLISLALSASVLLSSAEVSPSWATPARPQAEHYTAYFTQQALIPKFVLAYRKAEDSVAARLSVQLGQARPVSRRRALRYLFGIFTATAIPQASLQAQKPRIDASAGDLRYQEAERNYAIALQSGGFWHRSGEGSSNQAADFHQLTDISINNNRPIALSFLDQREAVAGALAEAAEDRSLSFGSDRLRAFGVRLGQDKEEKVWNWQDVAIFPSVTETGAFGRVAGNPGRGFWGNVLSFFTGRLESKNQSEARISRVYGALAKASAKFQDLLLVSEETIRSNRSLWLELHRSDLAIEQSEFAIESMRALLHRREAGARAASEDPSPFFEANDPQLALLLTQLIQLKTARIGIKNALAATIAQDGDAFQSAIRPDVAPTPLTRMDLEESLPIPSASEFQAAATIRAMRATTAAILPFDPLNPASVQEFWERTGLEPVTLPASLISAPSVQSYTIPWEEVLKPISADTPLGRSPQVTSLEFSLIVLAQARHVLEAETKTSWSAGTHLVLGVKPILSWLINFQIEIPTDKSRSKLLISQIDIAVRKVKDQIELVETQERGEFIKAREDWLQALDNARVTGDILARQAQQLLRELRRTDVVEAKYLEMTRMVVLQTMSVKRERIAAFEAWLRLQSYLPERRTEVRSAVIGHYERVLADVDATIQKPESKKTSSVLQLPGVPGLLVVGVQALHRRRALVNEVDATQPGEGKAGSWTRRLTMVFSGLALVPLFPSVARAFSFSKSISGSLSIGVEKGNTLSDLAVRYLRAEQPGHRGAFDWQTEILPKIAELQKKFGIQNPHRILEGQTFEDLSPNANLINHAHSAGASAVPQVTVPTQAPALPTASTHDSLSTELHHTFTDTLTQATHSFGSALDSITHWVFSGPEHFVIVAVGVVVTAWFLTNFMRRRHHGPNGNGYRTFFVAKMKTSAIRPFIGPALLLALALAKGAGSITFVAAGVSMGLGALQSPWLVFTSLIAASALLIGLRPGIRQRPMMRVIYPLGAAAATVYLTPGGWSFLARAVAFVVASGLLLLGTHGRYDSPLNWSYRLGRNQGVATILFPLLLVTSWLGLRDTPKLGSVAQMVAERVRERREILSHLDVLAPNYGVSLQPARLPVQWTPPSGVAGVITQVDSDRETLAPSEWALALDPLDSDLSQRARSANEEWQRYDSKELISSERLRIATRQLKAVVRVAPDTTVDHPIRAILEDVESELVDLATAHAIAEDNAGDAPGPRPLSFEEQAHKLRLRALGLRLNSQLLQRSQYNVPTTRATHILAGSGRVSEGTEVREGTSIALFTQELPDARFLQLKLPPPDVSALMDQWAKNAQGTLVRLRTIEEQPKIVDVPLSLVQSVIDPANPNYSTESGEENFFGPQFTNTAAGATPNFPVNLVVQDSTRRLDPAQRYEFLGVFDGDKRILGTAQSLGTLTLLNPRVAYPTQPLLLRPLEEQRETIAQLIETHETLRREILRFKQKFPEKSLAARLLADHDKSTSKLLSQRQALDQQIQNVRQTGVAFSANVQPRDPFAFAYYPLERRFRTRQADAELLAFGDSLRLKLTFDAYAHAIPSSTVYIRIPGSSEWIPFHLEGHRSLARTNPLTRYAPERTLSLAEVRRLFPKPSALTTALVEVSLAPPVETGSSGPSRLTSQELGVAFAWVGSAAFFASTLPLLDHSYLAWGIGYFLATGIHEFLGHGFTGWRQGRRMRLKWTASGLQWFEIGPTGEAQPVFNRDVQKAGPRASLWATGLSLTALLVAAYFYPLGMVSQVLAGIFGASILFRKADVTVTLPESSLQPESDASLNPLKTYPTLQATPVVRESQREQHAPRVLDAQGLKWLLQSLQHTVLEDERTWYKGEPTTYLSTKQLIWDATILRRERISYTLGNVFLRRFERDRLTPRDAALLDQQYRSEKSESVAGAKTRTFLWVLLIGSGGLIGSVVFADPTTLRNLLLWLQSNPLFLFATSGPVRSTVSIVLTVLIGGWLLGSALEWWGKLFATTPWNLRFLALKARNAFSASDLFVKNTGKDAMSELKKIYDADVLRPQDDDYAQFKTNLDLFARQMARRAHGTLSKDRFDAPSEIAVAFDAAFRIQLRRSGRGKRSPIYDRLPVELTTDTELFKRLAAKYQDMHDWTEEDQYRYLHYERIAETLSLMERYPIHTLMALLRSGNTELITQILTIKNQSLVEQVLNELKDRVNTLDQDVFEDLRSHDRLTTFFDMLHHVYEGLHTASNSTEQRDRDELLDFIGQAVREFEHHTWDQFIARLDDLMRHDPNRARGIVYTLTLRQLKEHEKETLPLLDGLRRRNNDRREDILKDRYLRNAQGESTTSVLELILAYQKYFDILREFVVRFPGSAIFGDRDIYVTCEDTVNFRQTLREIGLLLQLTRGTIYVLNIAGTHPNYSDLLDESIPDRIPGRDAGRIRITSLERPFILRRLSDPNAIIFSSAIPVEWNNIRKSAGIRVHEPSPLLKPTLLANLITDIEGDRLQKIFEEARVPLETERRQLEIEARSLQAALTQAWTDHQADAVDFIHDEPAPGISAGSIVEALRNRLALQNRGKPLARKQARLANIRTLLRELTRELNEMDRLYDELTHGALFLKSIGLHWTHYRDQSEFPLDTPPIVGKDPLNNHYRLDTAFYLHAQPRPEPQRRKRGSDRLRTAA